MKIIPLSLLLVTNISLAETVINNPNIDGKPIAAYAAEHTYHREFYIDVKNASATVACQLAGYNRAVIGKSEVQLMTKSRIKYFDANDFLVEEAYANYAVDLKQQEILSLWERENMTKEMIAPFVLKAKTKGLFGSSEIEPKKNGKVTDCEKASICRNHDGGFLLQTSLRAKGFYEFDLGTPFMNACYNWGEDSDNHYVFTKLVCEGAEQSEEIESFHIETNHRYRLVSAQAPIEGTVFEDAELACNTNLAKGSLEKVESGSCDYNPWVNRGGPPALFDTTDPAIAAILTGRLRKIPQEMPTCARAILQKYSSVVIKPEHIAIAGGHLNFCADKVTRIKEEQRMDKSYCGLTVKTTDFMGMKTSLKIEFYGNATDTQDKCDELYQCLNHNSLNCEEVNFCPPLGARADSKLNLPKHR